MDFTHSVYRDLCKSVYRSDYQTLTVYEVLKKKDIGLNDNLLVLRHDVDRFPECSLRMAEIENSFGIRASYYFRIPYSFDREIIKSISDMGHEVGLHYECIDKAAGDLDKASEILKSDLREFRDVAESNTVSMHGNPLSRFDNRELWKRYNLSDFDLTGEVYLSIDFEKFMYYSDTGRSWSDNKFNIKDHIPDHKSILVNKPEIDNTEDLIKLMGSDNRNIYLLAHPSRWSGTYFQCFCSYISDDFVNTGKLIIRFINGIK